MLRIVDYSEKAIALLGDTFSMKDEIKQLGGTFNKNLNIDNTKVAGWIIQKTKKSAIEELLTKIPTKTVSTIVNPHKAPINIDPKITHDMFANLFNKYEMLESRVIYLESMLKKSKNKPNNNNIPYSDDDEEIEIEKEQDVKPKRYLI